MPNQIIICCRYFRFLYLLPPELEPPPLPLRHQLVPQGADALEPVQAEGVAHEGQYQAVELHREVREASAHRVFSRKKTVVSRLAFLSSCQFLISPSTIVSLFPRRCLSERGQSWKWSKSKAWLAARKQQ